MSSDVAKALSADGVVARAIADAIRPDPPLSVWKWADEYRMLSSKAASAPGKYRSERTPYLREIMDCLSVESPVRKVVVKKPAQVGFSEALNNWIGYVIHHAPGPMLLVQPTVDLCKRYSKQRIAPMINETPVLTSRVAEEKSRDSSNTMLEKEFPGGMLLMTGANSSVGLRSMPAKFLALDEIDAYPPNVDDEGDPIELAVARTSTFARSKICMGSTPTVTGRSRIDVAFDETDQRQFWLPCPHCKDLQVLHFTRLVWPKGKPEKVEYQCIHCNQFIQNYQKTWMLARGEWRPTAECDPTIRGYALTGLLSPVGWLNWASIAAKYEQAEKKTDFLQTFYNTVLGESYSLGGETPNDARLYERRESYPIGRVPRGGLFLTGAVDVQIDRLEVEIKAWGRGRENWSVDYIVIHGSPKDQVVWDRLTEIAESSWPSEYGTTMKLSRLAVDSGYAADQVYAWARGKGALRTMDDLLREVWSRAEWEEAVFSAEEIEWADPEQFKLLCHLGFLKETERATWAQCETCGDGHAEEVVWIHNKATGNSEPFVPCPATGGARVSPDRLRRWAINLDAVAKATRHALGLTGNDSMLVPGRVWFLGRRQIAGRYRDIFFLAGAIREDGYQLWDRCRQIEDAPAPVILVPDQAPSPGRAPTFRLAELAILDDGRLSVDLEYLADALRQDRAAAPAKTLTSFPVPPDATWAELRLVVGEHTIVARLRNQEQEFGFEDLGLSGPEDRLWQLLCVLAHGGGRTPAVPSSISEKNAVNFRKQVSNLRQRLTAVFAIEGDPLVPVRGTGGYRSLFQINMDRHSGFPVQPERWEDCQFAVLPDGRIAISVPTREIFAARGICRETSSRTAQAVAERPSLRTEEYDLRALDLADPMGRPTAEGRVLLEFLRNGGKLTRRGDDMDILRLGRRLEAWMGATGSPFQFAPSRTLWSTRFETR